MPTPPNSTAALIPDPATPGSAPSMPDGSDKPGDLDKAAAMSSDVRSGLTLALVIPVWNDAEGLKRLLAQVAGLGVFSQVIVADDASDPPCSPQALGFDAAALGCEVISVRLSGQRGAGHARNRGLDRVTTSHVVFFDSDDLFTAEFRDLVADLVTNRDLAATADFTIFRHVDSRVRARGGYGPLESDQAYWVQAIGEDPAEAVTAPPVLLTRAGALALCRIAAYPWNKIYRTAFLRDQGIRCTEIPVHNDVELHWMSFLKARVIAASARVGCEHFVHEEGARLTNRTGAERLRVFEALSNLFDALESGDKGGARGSRGVARGADFTRLDYLEAYAEFLLRLFSWIRGTLEPELRAPFRARAQAFLLARLSPPLFTLIALRNPGLGARLTDALRGRAT